MQSGSGVSTVRTVIGIISIILFFMVSLYSCGVGLVNAVEDNISGSGFIGFLIAVIVLTAGIISIAARKSIGGSITAACFYLISSIIGIPFEDMVFWSIISLVFFCIIFISIVFDFAYRV